MKAIYKYNWTPMLFIFILQVLCQNQLARKNCQALKKVDTPESSKISSWNYAVAGTEQDSW